MQMKQPRVEEAHLGPKTVRPTDSKLHTLSATVGANLVTFLLQKILQNLLVRGLDRTHCLKGEIEKIQMAIFGWILG